MTRQIPQAELDRQRDFSQRVLERSRGLAQTPLAFVDTYGCQQNEADSELIRGMLREMGYGFTADEFAADVIVVNSCAIREHAEMRILGNVGALTHTKKAKPSQVVCLCGCMVQQEHMPEKIKKSYPLVDIVFGPHVLWRFPEFLYSRLNGSKRIFSTDKDDGAIAEGLPLARDGETKAWVSIMYGCNNFCTYCIVPYVRGRERSREPDLIIEEVRGLVGAGYRDITLLGQNVNSYGSDAGYSIDFAELMRRIDKIDGDYLIRFMTSHPKDATEKLFDVMAEGRHIARHIHLPVQAGNDRVLRAMNRGYTAGRYMGLVEYARCVMPDIVLTSDVIVGFPGETDREFEDTLRLVGKMRYDALFTFIYSAREGTPAAKLPDPYTREEKQARFDRLLELQNRVSAEKHAEYVGKTVRVLVDGRAEGKEFNLTARTNGGRLVHLRGGEQLIGSFARAKITAGASWSLYGELLPKLD